jgi:hypothetical protein
MKKQIAFVAAAGLIFLFFQSFLSNTVRQDGIPEDVATILKTSCYDCHFTGSKAEKALNKINYDHWDEYKLIKKIDLLGDIGEMLEEGKMPPEKYLENNPGARLSDTQKKVLMDWAREESEALMQGD